MIYYTRKIKALNFNTIHSKATRWTKYISLIETNNKSYLNNRYVALSILSYRSQIKFNRSSTCNMIYYTRKVRNLAYDTTNSTIKLSIPKSKNNGDIRSGVRGNLVISSMIDADVQYMRSIIKPAYSSTTK